MHRGLVCGEAVWKRRIVFGLAGFHLILENAEEMFDAGLLGVNLADWCDYARVCCFYRVLRGIRAIMPSWR